MDTVTAEDHIVRIPINNTVFFFNEANLIKMLLKYLKAMVESSAKERGYYFYRPSFISYCIHVSRKSGHDLPEFKIIEAALFRLFDEMVYSDYFAHNQHLVNPTWYMPFACASHDAFWSRS